MHQLLRNAEHAHPEADLALERENRIVGKVMKIRLYPFVPAEAEGVRSRKPESA